jgi:hypothetical protein
MRIGKFKKAAADRKRYVADYTDWLDANETLIAIDAAGNIPADAFFIDGFVVNTGGKEVIFYASGGVSGVSYTVTLTVNTSMGQIKQDTVTVEVI